MGQLDMNSFEEYVDEGTESLDEMKVDQKVTATIKGKKVKVKILAIDSDKSAEVHVVDLKDPDKDYFVRRSAIKEGTESLDEAASRGVVTNENPLITIHVKGGLAGQMAFAVAADMYELPDRDRKKVAAALVKGGVGKKIDISKHISGWYDNYKIERLPNPGKVQFALSQWHAKELIGEGTESLDEAYPKVMDFKKTSKEIGKLKSVIHQPVIRQISALFLKMFSNSSLKVRDDAVKQINKLKNRLDGDTRVDINKILNTNKMLSKDGKIIVEGTESLDEAKTVAQRQKMKQAFRKNKAKIALGRKKASRKLADPETLMKRARKHARDLLVKKLTKGKDKGELSFSQRGNIEKQVDKKKGAIDRIAKKLLPKIRQADKDKLKKNKPA